MIRNGELAKRISLIGMVAVLCGITALPVMAYSSYRTQDVYNFGAREGYSFGYKRGQEDYRAGRKFDFKEDGAYREGDYGYRKEYGHKGDYKRGFKEAFERAYYDGFYSRGYHGQRGGYFDGRNR